MIRDPIGSRVAVRAAFALYQCNPPIYDGQAHPTKLQDWLHRIEYLMVACDIDESDWVILAAGLLESDARQFWRGAVETRNAHEVPWGNFCSLLLAQFPPREVPVRMAPEVASTSQAQPHTGETEFKKMEKYIHKVDKFKMRPYDTVAIYADRFFSEIMTDPTIQLKEQDACFILWRGLTEELQTMVFPRWEVTYTLTQFVEEVTKLEETLAIEREEQERRVSERRMEFERRQREYLRRNRSVEVGVEIGTTSSPQQQGQANVDSQNIANTSEEEDPVEDFWEATGN